MTRAILGLPRAELQRIWDEVRANQARLDACVGPHDFQPIEDAKTPLARYSLCTKCGGRIDASGLRWYARGLAHGRLP